MGRRSSLKHGTLKRSKDVKGDQASVVRISYLHLDVIRELVLLSRLEQGLPSTVSDPSVISRLAVLVVDGGK